MLTEDGKIKVLDFGLAKAFSKETTDVDSSLSPTLTRDATRGGVIMGTAAYMSPEQARGKAVDKRSDIFSFGSVLYEMLAGHKAFPGEDISVILAAVIQLEPEMDRLPSELDTRLQRLLARCLDKDPRVRVRDIGELRIAHVWPQHLPGGRAGGKAVLFNIWPDNGVAVLDLETRDWNVVATSPKGASYVSTGHLVFFDDQLGTGLFATPFDSELRAITGPTVQVLSDVQVYGTASARPYITFSPDGTAV